ncbi:MAG: hypothetical protein R6V33_03010 [Pelovirga sp.]
MAEKRTVAKDYRPGLKIIRFRRWILWLVILAYLPAMMVALESPDYRRWVAIVFISWIVLLIVAVGYACLARCPRCGELYHTHGPTFLPLRRCLHCSLHLTSDKRIATNRRPRSDL